MSVHTTEIWKDIKGYVGFYQVSNLGRVRSLDRVIRHYNPRWKQYQARRLRGRILRPHFIDGGYPAVSLCRRGKYYPRAIHLLLMEAFVGPCPPGMETCHNNGISSDCRLENLRYDTRKNNHADKKKHGTHLFGQRATGSRTNRDFRQQVRQVWKTGKYDLVSLARKFSIPEKKARRIITSGEELGRRKDNVFIEAFGKRLTQTQWSRLSGLSVPLIQYRIHQKGMAPQQALTKPDRSGNCYKGGA